MGVLHIHGGKADGGFCVNVGDECVFETEWYNSSDLDFDIDFKTVFLGILRDTHISFKTEADFNTFWSLHMVMKPD